MQYNLDMKTCFMSRVIFTFFVKIPTISFPSEKMQSFLHPYYIAFSTTFLLVKALAIIDFPTN